MRTLIKLLIIYFLILHPGAGHANVDVMESGFFAANDTCDKMLMADGRELFAKVLVISPTEIRYKRCDMADGPEFVVRKSDVFMITYSNGSKDVIEADPPPPPARNREAHRDSVRKVSNRFMNWILWNSLLNPSPVFPMFRPF